MLTRSDVPALASLQLSNGEAALTPACRALLSEKLRIYPTLGGTQLRRLSEEGQTIYRARDAGLTQALAGTQVHIHDAIPPRHPATPENGRHASSTRPPEILGCQSPSNSPT